MLAWLSSLKQIAEALQAIAQELKELNATAKKLVVPPVEGLAVKFDPPNTHTKE